jgi:hypothetical protein
MNQVLAMRERDTGEIPKGGIDKIEVVPYPTNTGIGMESGDNRIAVRLCVHDHGGQDRDPSQKYSFHDA